MRSKPFIQMGALEMTMEMNPQYQNHLCLPGLDVDKSAVEKRAQELIMEMTDPAVDPITVLSRRLALVEEQYNAVMCFLHHAKSVEFRFDGPDLF